MANYDSMTTDQKDRFTALMAQSVKFWPVELKQWVRQPGPEVLCGDALADAVAGWVKAQAAA
jgi:hypothetical protein